VLVVERVKVVGGSHLSVTTRPHSLLALIGALVVAVAVAAGVPFQVVEVH
jgi:hypothetical protein